MWSEKTLGKRTRADQLEPARKKFQKRVSLSSLSANEFSGAKLVFDGIQSGTYTDSTQLRDLGSLRSLCTEDGLDPESEFYRNMTTKISELRASIQIAVSKNQLEKSDRGWVKWDTIETMLRQLDEAVQKTPNNYRQQQQRLLLQMYVYHPPWRHNFHHVPIVTVPLETHQNYLQRIDDQWTMHLGFDKTIDRYGPEDRTLDTRIGDALNALEKSGARSYFLTLDSDRSKPLDDILPVHVRPHRLLSSIPNELGVPSGLKVDVIRSSYATRHHGAPECSLFEKHAIARSMRTSHSMLESYYHKVPIS